MPAASLSHASSKPLPFGALIHISNSCVRVDLCEPWKTADAGGGTGTGFAIGGRRILTNSRPCVEAHGKPGNYAGRILCESRMCDLALVTVDDDEFWESVPATHFSTETPSLDATVAGANATCALQIRAPAPASLACTPLCAVGGRSAHCARCTDANMQYLDGYTCQGTHSLMDEPQMKPYTSLGGSSCYSRQPQQHRQLRQRSTVSTATEG